MQKRTTVFVIILALLITAVSCRKGQFAPEEFQAGVVISSSQLTTTRLEVQFDDSPVRDSLVAGGTAQKTFTLTGKETADGKSVKFKVYKAGSDEVIADTSFVLHKTTQQSYKIIYNEELGLGGFLNGTNVPADSIRVRIVYHDMTAAKKYASLEWSFYQTSFDVPYYDSADNVNIRMVLDTAKYSADFYIPIFRKDGATYTNLYAILKDPVTGQYLYWFPDFAVFPTPMQTPGDWDGGAAFFLVFNLTDSYSDSGIDYYNLDFSYIKL